ncbi:MAG TPA: hypothetical protein VK186_01025 [Candidatus Deferrimicrobium sp.]|nr:hypothetical protein [Candidatus Deferrimicrobium sp.]
MHRKFLEYLTKICEVYLVSRYMDERLKYAEPNDFRIFIPDLHLIDNKREKKYKYTTNNPALFLDMLTELMNFKEAVSLEEVKVTVYQLGDFLDLWRQVSVSFSSNKATQKLIEGAQKIQEDKQAIVAKLKELNTQFVFGNHDFDLQHIPDFAGTELRYFFPLEETSAFTLHGDVFSLFEKSMPVSLKNLGVNVFGPSVKPGTRQLGEFRKEVIKLGLEQANQSNQFQDYIQQPTPIDLIDIIHITPETIDIDDVINETNFNINTNLTYLKEAGEFASTVNQQQGWDLRFGVISHTHRARIAVNEPSLAGNNPEEFFALIDCGGWVGNCIGTSLDGTNILMPSAQIGVLYNNEARIYQLFREK